MKAKQSFIDKLMGISRIDNESNPASALNKRKRLQRPTPVTKQPDDMRQHLEYVQRMKKGGGGKGWGP